MCGSHTAVPRVSNADATPRRAAPRRAWRPFATCTEGWQPARPRALGYARRVTSIIDSFWRAAAYCLHPRVILWSLAPLLATGLLAGVLAYFFWADALAATTRLLQTWPLAVNALDWLGSVGAGGAGDVLALVLVVALSLPLAVVVSLFIVALVMMPRLVDLVARRRFPLLERRHGEPAWRGALVSLGATLVAVVAFFASMPLWLVPPLVLVLPPVIWGWLAYRVMSFDALAEHATRDERLALMRTHRLPLMGIGIATGYLGAAPALVWAVSAGLLVALAPVLIVASVWLYTLVFTFSALWFVHYGLAALETLRAAERAPAAPLIVQASGA